MSVQDKPLSIHFNADSVTIEGITYANDMFRQFGGLMPVNTPFRLVGRSTGITTGTIDVVYLEDHEKELAKIKKLAWAVIEEEMSGVRVHPCDEHSEEVKARGMQPVYQALYEAIKNGH